MNIACFIAKHAKLYIYCLMFVILCISLYLWFSCNARFIYSGVCIHFWVFFVFWLKAHIYECMYVVFNSNFCQKLVCVCVCMSVYLCFG